MMKFKKLLSVVAAVSMIASIGLVSSVQAKDSVTTIIDGIPEAGQREKAGDNAKIYFSQGGTETCVSDGKQMVCKSNTAYSATDSGAGANYSRAYVYSDINTTTAAGTVYYEWTLNCSAAPAFIAIYTKNCAGSWSIQQKLNYSYGGSENHLWNTGNGGSIPIGKDFAVGMTYDVATGAYQIYTEDKASKKNYGTVDPANGIGQCWLEFATVGADDTITFKNVGAYQIAEEDNDEDYVFEGLPMTGLNKTEGSVSEETVSVGTGKIINQAGQFVISGDNTSSTGNFSRIYLNTTAYDTGYLWYEYTVNMSDIPRLIAINTRDTAQSCWQYGENINYSYSAGENHLLRTVNGGKLEANKDYTFGFFLDLATKKFVITQDGVASRLSGTLSQPSKDMGVCFLEVQMLGDATCTVKNATVRHLDAIEVDNDALFDGLPVFTGSKTMNGITVNGLTVGGTIVNGVGTYTLSAVHQSNNSTYSRVYTNGIINSERQTGKYLVEYTIKSATTPRVLGFYSRADGGYPVNCSLNYMKEDEDYTVLKTDGSTFIPNHEYTFGYEYDATTGAYQVYQDGVKTAIKGTVPTVDNTNGNSVKTLSDFFFEVQTNTADESVEITNVKVTVVPGPSYTLVDYGNITKDDTKAGNYYEVTVSSVDNELTLGVADKEFTITDLGSFDITTALTYAIIGSGVPAVGSDITIKSGSTVYDLAN